MTTIVRINEGDYGMTYTFTIEDVDYSSYTATITVWQGDTKIVDGDSCSVSLSGSDTQVTYTPTTGTFDTPGTYNAYIEFTGSNFKEKTKQFQWEVIESD